MCQSWVATTWSNWPWCASRYSLISPASSAPPVTAREPPSQKSFWTSTMSNARDISVLLIDGGDGCLAALKPVDHRGQLLHCLGVAAARALDRLGAGPPRQDL